jgi:hypothetical protein
MYNYLLPRQGWTLILNQGSLTKAEFKMSDVQTLSILPSRTSLQKKDKDEFVI